MDINRAYLIKPGQQPVEIKPIDPKQGFSLAECYDHIGNRCHLIEVVLLTGKRWMILDEEGKLKSSHVNSQATEIFLDGRMPNSDVVVGAVIVCPKKMLK